MAEAKRDNLDNDYPMELQEVTKAVNRLSRISHDQKGRYRHANGRFSHRFKNSPRSNQCVIR
ncbi:hypothetical protein [Photobacterium leiognathi]|uniref:hypothetical protein n=1 Tax=Photobacterium leiognathi TaxID=553611 RepID=UPI002738A88F|nr:hypothetical protein [Photobacterium leiognathi]